MWMCPPCAAASRHAPTVAAQVRGGAAAGLSAVAREVWYLQAKLCLWAQQPAGYPSPLHQWG
jgi:hypothetical protein